MDKEEEVWVELRLDERVLTHSVIILDICQACHDNIFFEAVLISIFHINNEPNYCVISKVLLMPLKLFGQSSLFWFHGTFTVRVQMFPSGLEMKNR